MIEIYEYYQKPILQILVLFFFKFQKQNNFLLSPFWSDVAG